MKALEKMKAAGHVSKVSNNSPLARFQGSVRRVSVSGLKAVVNASGAAFDSSEGQNGLEGNGNIEDAEDANPSLLYQDGAPADIAVDRDAPRTPIPTPSTPKSFGTGRDTTALEAMVLTPTMTGNVPSQTPGSSELTPTIAHYIRPITPAQPPGAISLASDMGMGTSTGTSTGSSSAAASVDSPILSPQSTPTVVKKRSSFSQKDNKDQSGTTTPTKRVSFSEPLEEGVLALLPGSGYTDLSGAITKINALVGQAGGQRPTSPNETTALNAAAARVGSSPVTIPADGGAGTLGVTSPEQRMSPSIGGIISPQRRLSPSSQPVGAAANDIEASVPTAAASETAPFVRRLSPKVQQKMDAAAKEKSLSVAAAAPVGSALASASSSSSPATNSDSGPGPVVSAVNVLPKSVAATTVAADSPGERPSVYQASSVNSGAVGKVMAARRLSSASSKSLEVVLPLPEQLKSVAGEESPRIPEESPGDIERERASFTAISTSTSAAVTTAAAASKTTAATVAVFSPVPDQPTPPPLPTIAAVDSSLYKYVPPPSTLAAVPPGRISSRTPSPLPLGEREPDKDKDMNIIKDKEKESVGTSVSPRKSGLSVLSLFANAEPNPSQPGGAVSSADAVGVALGAGLAGENSSGTDAGGGIVAGKGVPISVLSVYGAPGSITAKSGGLRMLDAPASLPPAPPLPDYQTINEDMSKNAEITARNIASLGLTVENEIESAMYKLRAEMQSMARTVTKGTHAHFVEHTEALEGSMDALQAAVDLRIHTAFECYEQLDVENQRKLDTLTSRVDALARAASNETKERTYETAKQMDALAGRLGGDIKATQRDVASTKQALTAALNQGFSAQSERLEEVREADRKAMFSLLREGHSASMSARDAILEAVAAGVRAQTEQLHLAFEAMAARLCEQQGRQALELTRQLEESRALQQASYDEMRSMREGFQASLDELKLAAGQDQREVQAALSAAMEETHALLKVVDANTQARRDDELVQERTALTSEVEALKRRLFHQEQLTYDAKKEASRLQTRVVELERGAPSALSSARPLGQYLSAASYVSATPMNGESGRADVSSAAASGGGGYAAYASSSAFTDRRGVSTTVVAPTAGLPSFAYGSPSAAPYALVQGQGMGHGQGQGDRASGSSVLSPMFAPAMELAELAEADVHAPHRTASSGNGNGGGGSGPYGSGYVPPPVPPRTARNALFGSNPAQHLSVPAAAAGAGAGYGTAPPLGGSSAGRGPSGASRPRPAGPGGGSSRAVPAQGQGQGQGQSSGQGQGQGFAPAQAAARNPSPTTRGRSGSFGSASGSNSGSQRRSASPSMFADQRGNSSKGVGLVSNSPYMVTTRAP